MALGLGLGLGFARADLGVVHHPVAYAVVGDARDHAAVERPS